MAMNEETLKKKCKGRAKSFSTIYEGITFPVKINITFVFPEISNGFINKFRSDLIHIRQTFIIYIYINVIQKLIQGHIRIH